MPRPNRVRTIHGESNLARRIAFERDARGLTYDALAKLMTDAGCPIQGSAIFKIEKGSPPRRVTVDELVALSTVFRVGIEELLTPMELIEQERAKALIKELHEVSDLLGEATTRDFNLYTEYFELAARNPELREYVDNHWFGTSRPRGERAPAFLAIDDQTGEDLGESFDDLERAVTDFQQAIITAAADRVLASMNQKPKDKRRG